MQRSAGFQIQFEIELLLWIAGEIEQDGLEDQSIRQQQVIALDGHQHRRTRGQ